MGGGRRRVGVAGGRWQLGASGRVWQALGGCEGERRFQGGSTEPHRTDRLFLEAYRRQRHHQEGDETSRSFSGAWENEECLWDVLDVRLRALLAEACPNKLTRKI